MIHKSFYVEVIKPIYFYHFLVASMIRNTFIENFINFPRSTFFLVYITLFIKVFYFNTNTDSEAFTNSLTINE